MKKMYLDIDKIDNLLAQQNNKTHPYYYLFSYSTELHKIKATRLKKRGLRNRFNSNSFFNYTNDIDSLSEAVKLLNNIHNKLGSF